MQHTAKPSALRLEDLHHIAVRLAVMDADGQLELTREIELAHEDRTLQRTLFLILLPIIVEPDLADGDDLFLRRPCGKLLVRRRRHRLRLLGMDPDRRIDRIELLRERDAPRRGLEAVAHRDDLHDAGCQCTLNDGGAVVRELLAVEVRVRIDKLHHFTLLPADATGSTRCSPLSSAVHRIMPCERMPRIFAGFKFATRTTFLPTSSSAA